MGIVTYIPKAHVSPKLKKEVFTKDEFRYDPTNDVYVCPEVKLLTLRGITTERKKVRMRYSHHLFEVSVGERVPAVPVNAQKDDGWLEVTPLKRRLVPLHEYDSGRVVDELNDRL